MQDDGAGIGVSPPQTAAAPSAATEQVPLAPAEIETIALDIEADSDPSAAKPQGCCAAGLLFLWALLAAIDWAVDEVIDRLPPRRKTLMGKPIG